MSLFDRWDRNEHRGQAFWGGIAVGAVAAVALLGAGLARGWVLLIVLGVCAIAPLVASTYRQ